MRSQLVTKRWTGLAASLALAALILAACAPAASSPTATVAPTAAEATQAPTSAAEMPTAPAAGGNAKLMVATDPQLGQFLTDANGMTLYLYTKDAPGVSNCADNCAKAWPPLTATAAPQAGDGVTGQIGLITRADGTQQVTYDNIPLYYYAADQKAGDTTGQGVGGVWFVVPPSGAPATGPTATPAASSGGGYGGDVAPGAANASLKVASDAKLGQFLVDANGMTLYLYTKDTTGVSNCADKCAQAWPPLLATAAPAAGEGVTGQIALISRADGGQQVTYNGVPLYYYTPDQKPGDVTGQEVGGVWFVVAP